MEDQNQQQARQLQSEWRKRVVQTFERALTDPAFRQRFLENAPPIAKDSEGNVTVPQLPPEAQAKRRQLLEQVLERASSDTQFRQQLLDNPREALWAAGFGGQIEQFRAELPQGEVRGFDTLTQYTFGGGTTSIFVYNPGKW